MPQRLPNLGESPYKTILDGFLEVNLQTDGTLTALASHSATPAAFTALNGSSLVANRRYNVTGSGTTKQRAFVVEIAGSTDGTSLTDRIAGYFGAQTGGAGSGGNNIWGLNVIVQNNSADADTQAVGIELNVNNNKADATSDLSGSVLKYGYSADSGGSKIASVAYAVSASGAKWRRGFRVGSAAIASGGYAFEYLGNGSTGAVRITDDSLLTIGTPGAVSSAILDATSSSPRSARLIFGTDNGGWELRFSKRAAGVTTDLWGLNDSGHLLPVTTNSFDIGSATRICRKGYFTDLQFGTNTAKGAEAFASFITVTDAAGNSRKLMVCA